MKKRMLIDATHEEETRVAVLEDNRLVDFDYESELRKPLKGSIFLAKVTRVEPSLQAAFVNFGGNRHGFLPFSEIHPDYFRIPIADREALMAEQEAALAEAEAEEEAEEAAEEEAMKAEEEKGKGKGKKSKKDDAAEEDAQDADDDNDVEEEAAESDDAADDDASEDDVNGNVAEDADDADGNADENTEDEKGGNNRRGRRGGRGRGGNNRRGRGRNHRSKGAQKYDDNAERRFRFNLRRKYKIQEVIKRGQIMLVQVNKEERGNKGAAVGSYLSLPGRYCVLMPNSPRAGGVSRKIANYKDRKRMREIMKELEVPKGMSVILRTAGLERTKTEIKRDLDYLIKLWNNIRELTLESSAPALVYEEADLIKRSVRDLYTRDVEEVVVAGEKGYKNAKNFMKMMIPSHAKKVKEFKDEGAPLFNKYKVESQIAEIGETQVTLPSGGYLVINPTEALVSVDVNSGKSTKERHIEETALRTNLEAAVEVARQLRLRDLGGLVVIDFIDMEDRRNNGKVERKMRDALSTDRARVQVGRISSFGLMELSRQRLSPSLTESQFESCAHCAGTGRIRTADATTIMVLRALEDEGIKGRAAQVIVHVTSAVAVYILNNKRDTISSIEQRYGFQVVIRTDETIGATGHRIEVSKPSGGNNARSNDDNNDDSDDENNSSRGGRRRGRRGGRGRGRNRDRDRDENRNDDSNNDQDNAADDNQAPADDAKSDKDEKPKKSSRGRKKADDSDADSAKKDDKKESKTSEKSADEKSDDKKKAAPKKRAAAKSKSADKVEEASDKAEKPKKKVAAKKSEKKSEASNDDGKSDAHKEHEVVNQAPEKKKKGWWSR